jgi:hypothetical protein
MKSINRFIYGPTPEEKIRDWQSKLRTQERQLDREVANVRRPPRYLVCHPMYDSNHHTAGETYTQIPLGSQGISQEE